MQLLERIDYGVLILLVGNAKPTVVRRQHLNGSRALLNHAVYYGGNEELCLQVAGLYVIKEGNELGFQLLKILG